MSPAFKSKSKDKKASKEPPKGSAKPSVHVNTTSGAPASGYNPLLGTFHTFETSPVPTASPLQGNIRFRNIDDTDHHNNGNSSTNGVEYDSVSNNGSWSGESEDHKEKTPSQPHQSVVLGTDNDKREKIRLKNEKKHQRQKERRAQELHERCSGYLMSRKLEALSQQLVAMGFSRERATMALILNEGRVEESVTWLFEGSKEEDNKQTERNLSNSGGNLKIEISEELACITEMEIRYKASKQEVERVVVSCEGDLDKAEEILKAQKEVAPKPEEIGDPPSIANSKQQPIPVNQNPIKIQPKSTSATITQQKRDETDFNYTKLSATVGFPVDPGTKSVQVLKKVPPKSGWTKPQQIATTPTSFSSSSPLLASPLPPPNKTEPPKYVVVGNELKNLQLRSIKEPVIVMQRPQSITTTKQIPPSTSLSSSSSGSNMGWYSNPAESVKPNGFVPSFCISRSLSSPNDVSSSPWYNQFHYQSQQYVSNNGLWNRGASPALAAASSLGLFSGIGTNGSSGSVDWKMGGSILQCDYANVDWSLDRGSLPPRPNGLGAGGANYSVQNNARGSDSFGYGVKSSGMRPVILSNGNGAVVQRLQEGVGSNDLNPGGSSEWSSPFEEKDIFSLPRQYVSSPSL